MFGVNLPIIQAPMAGAQASALALAVAQAGGLGSLPCAMLSKQIMREEVAALQAAHAPINFNFFCHTPPTEQAAREAAWRARLEPYFAEFGLPQEQTANTPSRTPFSAEALQMLRELVKQPQSCIISFHFGLPADDLLQQVRAWGARIFGCATSVAEACWLAERGVDAIIAQGLEAGGHRGMFLSEDISTQSGTFALLPQVVRAVRCPVIAAGGIADAQGVRAALALGASAAQIGTAYLLCPESSISAPYRAALQTPAAQHTALTNLFSGRPARGIVNRFMRELGPINDEVPAFPLASNAIAALRAHAEKLGLSDFSPLWAGQNVSGCKAIGAAQLTRELAGI